TRHRPVHGGPRFLDLAGEAVSQTLFESPEERGTDGVVVFVYDTIRSVALAEVLQNGDQRVEVIQTVDCGVERLHEQLALNLDGGLEEELQSRINLEEPPIEQFGSLVGNGHYFRPALLNQLFRLVVHRLSLLQASRNAKPVSRASG